MKLVSGIVDSGFFAQSALSAEVATKDSLGRNISETYLTAVPEGYATEDWVTGQGYITAHQSLDGLMSADLLEISDNKITGYNGTAFAGQGGGVTGDFELSAGSGISIVDYPLEQKTVISVTAQGGNPEVEQAVIYNSATWDSVTGKQDSLTFGYKETAISSIDSSALYDNSAHARITTLAGRISNLSSNKLDSSALIPTVESNTISYSAKPTEEPIYASGNDLNNVNSIHGRSNLAIVPNGVLQVPKVITATNGVLQVPNAITATNGNLTVQNAISAVPNNTLNVPGVITSNQGGITVNGLSANITGGLTANGLTADASKSGFSAIGISAGKQGPLIIQGAYGSISSTNREGFTFSSQNTAFGTAQLTTAYGNQLVQMTAPKFEAKNVSGAGFSIEASGAKGYDESGNVVWDTNNPQIKNIISYSDTKTAQGGLNGNIILTTQPSTTTSNLTSSPYVIMDAAQASYFAAYGPSAQTPTVSMMPSQITFGYEAGNAKTTVGYNDVKQELSGSSWTLTGSIQKRELEYDANTSAITAIAGSAIGGDCGGSALPISAGKGIKFELVNDTLVASVTSTYTSGYVWQSASLFHTDTPVKQTTYTLSDNCSNYDRLDVDFYDINNWRTVMECPIPSNLDASGTRGGYFSVVPANTGTGADIWFKAFNWTAAGTTWSCYCSELAGKGGSTTQTINANHPDNPPRVVNIIGWKRIEV